MVKTCQGWMQCSEEDGGGVCPDYHTCCATGVPGRSSCIAGRKKDHGRPGECCMDDGGFVSGCATGYQCASWSTSDAIYHHTQEKIIMEEEEEETVAADGSLLFNPLPNRYCRWIDPENNEESKPLRIPRYELCTVTREALQVVHGLPFYHIEEEQQQKEDQVMGRSTDFSSPSPLLRTTRPTTRTTTTGKKEGKRWKLAYLSNMGSLDDTSNNDDNHLESDGTDGTTKREKKEESLQKRHASVRAALIMVHGSGRNADGYFCAAVSTVQPSITMTQSKSSAPTWKLIEEEEASSSSSSSSSHMIPYAPDEVLVIAPWFLTDQDNYPDSLSSSTTEEEGEEEKDRELDGRMTSTTETTISSSASGKDSSTVTVGEEEENNEDNIPFLRWWEEGYLTHTWRFGADAINVSISSFDAMDAFVERLAFDKEQFPNLEKIVVTGHSAGGQFAQRWALTSSSPVFSTSVSMPLSTSSSSGDEEEKSKDDDREENLSPTSEVNNSNPAKATSPALRASITSSTSSSSPNTTTTTTTQGRPLDLKKTALASFSSTTTSTTSVRVVAANPRCLAFLDGRRYIDGEFRIPDDSFWVDHQDWKNSTTCPEYDQWIWGLQDEGPLPTRYRDAAVNTTGGIPEIVRRYADRDVVYLAGSLDTEMFADDCGSVIQGPNRKIRSERFFRSLREIYPDRFPSPDNEDATTRTTYDEDGEGRITGGGGVHHRVVVPWVNHDHTLLYQSPSGRMALFGTIENEEEEHEVH